MRRVKGILRRVSRIFKEKSEVEIKPQFPGIENQINSEAVSPGAIKGDHITISKGSFVSHDSSIGSYTYVGFNTFISKTSIGRYNSIANNVNIGHGEHSMDTVSTNSFVAPITFETLTKLDCTVTHDVWICAGATIRRGVTLGIGCVVGANSFVNKDVPPYAVVGGVPARLIKYRFSPEKIQRILASKWWEHDQQTALSIIEKLEKNDQGLDQ